MESANIHQKHSLQDQQLVGSSTLDSSSFAAGTAHAWTPNTILNTAALGSYANAALVNTRIPRLQNGILVSSLLNDSMSQDSGYHWANSVGSFTNQSSHELQLSLIKRELSADSFPRSNEMISSSSSRIGNMQTQPACYAKEHRDMNDMNVKFLLRTLSSGGQSNGIHSGPEEFYCSSSSSSTAVTPKRGTFSQIYPTINVSDFNQTSLANSGAFGMNLQALDLFDSARLSGTFRQPVMEDHLGVSRSDLSYRLDYMKQSIQRPLDSSNMTPFSSGLAEAKRSDIILEPKASQTASKRSRVESRASCPPFKVRKEKLGDRIAALQQLVAPFGKTDTASVLMEAIGYIKFLQNQVETLSVPYLKSSRNKTNRALQGSSLENGNEERKRDLRSRGLCLVPLSCLAYVTDIGGGLWPPPNFGGGT